MDGLREGCGQLLVIDFLEKGKKEKMNWMRKV